MSSFNGHLRSTSTCQGQSNTMPQHQPTNSNNYPSTGITQSSMSSNTESSSVFLQQKQQPINQVTSSNSLLNEQCRRSEIEDEDDLMETIDRLVHVFLSRPGRRQPCKTLFQWSINCGTMPSYHVMVTIDQDSHSTPSI
ncbi:unnamed protein product [Rotaria sp. Silwood2]|nr:unnamed protein product [Rotaria sp. Silwood2]